MKVKAIKPGFYAGALIEPGQLIEVPDGAKASWYVPAAEYKAPVKEKPKAQPKTLSELAKAPVATAADIA